MNGSGRMLHRCARAFRDDDICRAAEWRRETPTSTTTESARVAADHPRAILRAATRRMLAAAGRLRTRSA